jgi:hypothetical protein
MQPRNFPQGLKPKGFEAFAARLKPCHIKSKCPAGQKPRLCNQLQVLNGAIKSFT